MGCYSIADFRVVPALRADRRKMLLNLQEANIKEGIPIVASVEALVLLGTDEAPASHAPASSTIPNIAPPAPLAHPQHLQGTVELADTPHSDAAPHAHYTPPLFSRTNDTLRHVIQPTVHVTLPWSIPLALTEKCSFLSDVCGYSPVSEYPALHILAAMGAAAADHPLPAGLGWSLCLGPGLSARTCA